MRLGHFETSSGVRIRAAEADDGPFLVEVLALAAAWRPGSTPPTAETVLSEPALARYVAGWPRPGDLGFVAVDNGEPIGAAWWRYFDGEDHGYGYVAADVPELSIGVVEGRRGDGVGTALMVALLAEADQQGLDQLSLSVEAGNPALRLYERLGFAPAPGAEAGTLIRSRPTAAEGARPD